MLFESSSLLSTHPVVKTPAIISLRQFPYSALRRIPRLFPFSRTKNRPSRRFSKRRVAVSLHLWKYLLNQQVELLELAPVLGPAGLGVDARRVDAAVPENCR